MRRATLAILAGALLLRAGPAAAVSGFPQAKINEVDVTAAPKVELSVTLLDKYLRPVPEKWLEEAEVVVYEKPPRQTPKELFRFVEGEAVMPGESKGESKGEGEGGDEEGGPSLSLAKGSDEGMAVTVVMPGFAAPAYRNGVLGQRMRNGAKLFFKKLGKNNQMNVIWYNDRLWSFVRARGRTGELTRLSPSIRERCRAWRLKQLEKGETEGKKGDEKGLADDQYECGLTSRYGKFGEILGRTAYQGFYPRLFGLQQPLCGDPRHERMGERGQLEAGQGLEPIDAEKERPPAAFETALRMLARDAEPGQPRALVLLGDGRDGYIFRLRECRQTFRRECADRHDDAEKVRSCVNDRVQKMVVEGQKRFRRRLPRWIALARAANIRVYSVVNPNAEPYQRARMRLLALRTGGTARVAEDSNEVVEAYTNLIAELNRQIVIGFEDEKATPGSTRQYKVRLEGGGRAFPTEPYEVEVPKRAGAGGSGGGGGLIGSVKGTLGSTVFWIVVGVLALLLAILLLVLLTKLLGKLFSGGDSTKKAKKKKAKKAKKAKKKKAKKGGDPSKARAKQIAKQRKKRG